MDRQAGWPKPTWRNKCLGVPVAFAIWILVPTAAAQSSPVISAVTAYRSALEGLQSQTGPTSLEPVFDAAVAVRQALFCEDGESTVIEELSPNEFEDVSHMLTGLVVNREELLIVAPDTPFFLALARRYGREVDIRFFENFLATYPDSVWPVYLEQQTDVTGCTPFGSGALTGRYAGWRQFRAAHPNAYSGAVAGQLEEIESAIAESTCACGTKSDVIRELQEFAETFPDSPVIQAVRRRLREAQNSQSPFRFECLSG